MNESGNSNEQFDFDDEEDDYLLAEAVEASVAACEMNASVSGFDDGDEEEMANISFGIENPTVKQTRQNDPSGFDRSSGHTWIYPTNYPIRDYQYNIVQQALHRNTLVVLPTGLGKTFIAAVVMYNLYRWFPQGKVVFMAPTKPLVAQQIHACYTITGIPKNDTVEMTGNMNPCEREKEWRRKRVIFLTPQVMTNDLSRGSFAATSIKCLVVDEAHKATGNHAYCQVVRELLNFTQDFRVLALSATPGSDLKKVQQVMTNLLIAHIELRSEDSIDIRPYTHERRVDKIVVPMGEELSGIRLKYIQIMEMVVKRLIKIKVLYNREATMLTKFLILKAREEFRQNPPQNVQGPQSGMIEGDFAMAMSLYHGFELLQLHGLRSLYNFLMGIQAGDKGYGRTRYELARNPDFNDIMESLHEKFASKKLIGKGEEKDEKIAVGHPKMQRLEEIVIEHFKSFQENNMDTRVMIFSQYRDSGEEICNILSQHHPLVKVMAFIGQSSVGKSSKGYSQKEQLKVMRLFREGGYNALVSTCVGEEGLDIGDVDLIVCFDAHKDPTRLVQRMGRTGRKRKGRIVMLVTQGIEEQIYNRSLYSKKSVHKAILNGAKTLHFYPHNPSLIPSGIKPTCHKMFITIKPETDSKATSSLKAKGKDKSKASSSNQDISSAFNKARSKRSSSSELSQAEYEEIRQEFCQALRTAKRLPKPKCIILSKNSQEEEESDPDSMINLSEWTMWQNRLQQSHFVGHSTHTQNLVQTCEFIMLQESIGEEGNSYGLEMELYLNKADVVKSSWLNQSYSNVPGQSSIKSFFTPSQSGKHGNQSSRKDSETPLSTKSGVGIELNEADVGKGKKRLKDKSSHDIKRGKGGKRKKSSDKAEMKLTKSKKPSNLFTVLKPSVLKGDDEGIGIINKQNHEVTVIIDDEDIDNAPPMKKKNRKKKLLDAADCMWKDNDLSRSEACDVKDKNHRTKIWKLGVERQLKNDGDGDLDMDFESGPVQQIKIRKGNSSNEIDDAAHNDEGQHSECESGQANLSDNYLEMIESGDSDVEAMEVVEQAFPEGCNDICLIPSPPRVEEVAELFEQLTSPLDFVSLDIYHLVDKWQKTEPFWKCPSLSNVSADRSNLEPKTPDAKLNVGVNDDIDNEIDENLNESNYLLKRRKSKMLEEDKQEGGSVVTTLVNTSTISSFRINRPTNKHEQNKELHENVCDNTVNGGCKDLSMVESRQGHLHLPSNRKLFVETGQSVSKHQNMSLPIAASKEPVSQTNRQKIILSPNNDLSNSMDEVMQAMHVENCVFSPPTRTASRSKLMDTSLKNMSSHSQSFATFSQALACLHSSSSDNLLSPNNSVFTKSVSSYPSSRQEKNHSISGIHELVSPGENKRSMKMNRASLSPTETKELSSGASTSGLIGENSVKNTSRERKHSHPDNGTPQKLTKLGFDSFYDSEDEFGCEIIPPTPHKNNSGIASGNIQVNQASILTKRTLDSCSSQNRDRSLYVKGSSVPSENDSKSAGNMKALLRKGKDINKTTFHSTNTSMNNEAKLNPIFLLSDSEGDDCATVTPPCIRKMLPFSQSRNTECVKMMPSQSQAILVSPESPQGKETPASVNTLATTKKKMLSLKFVEGENQSPAKDEIVSIQDDALLLLKSRSGLLSASTPLMKDFRNVLEDEDEDEAMFDMDHLTPIKGHLPSEEKDIEESFIIRRKKKPTTVLDFSSDNETKTRNSWLSAKGKSDRKKSHESSKEKSKSFEEWQASCLEGFEDDDDFEDPAPILSKARTHMVPSRKDKSVKKIKRGANFIEDEAEVTDDTGTSDEHDGDADDCYEGSFINNNTEMTQADVTEDMRAVYLKSVKSPVQGKYKFQFNCANNADIYSQALPEDQGMSEYEEDSFCVGSDEEEESPVVVKKSTKNKKGKPQRKQDGPMRRVRVLSDSSSDEANALPFTQECTTNQRAIAQKALMSSSDDEWDTGNQKNPRKTNAVNNSDCFGAAFNCGLEKSHSINPVSKVGNTDILERGKPCVSSKLPAYQQASTSETRGVDKSVDLKTSVSRGDIDINEGIGLDEWLDDFDAVDKNSASKPKTLMPQETARKMLTPKTSISEYGEFDKASAVSKSALRNLNSSQFSTKSEMVTKAGIQNYIVPSDYHRFSMDYHENSTTLRSTKQRISSDKSDSSSASYTKPCNFATMTSAFSSKDISCVSDMSHQTESSMKNCGPVMPGRDVEREERLKRQKEKQERFRQKLAQVQQTKPVPLNVTKADETVKVHSSLAGCSDISINVPVTTGKEVLQVIVDTKEISAAQEVISALRLKHNISVTARQIGSCDYVLSNHLVIDRLYWSAFSNGSNRSKLTSRLCEMQSLYRKCALVIEADRLKQGQEKHRKILPRSKYTDRTMAGIIQTGVKIYFTDSAEQTAALLSELCQTEQRKGRHLAVPTKLNPKKEGIFSFVFSIPQVNIMEALNLVHKYSNVSEIISSPVTLLQKRGCLQSEKAQWVYNYFRHKFDIQMIPASCR